MSSSDIYVRKDVYEADQRALIAEIKLGNGEILRVIDQFRTEMQDMRKDFNSKIEQVRTELKGDIAQVRSEFKEDLNQFRGEVNERFGKVEGQIMVLNGAVDGLNRRMDYLQSDFGLGVGFISLVIVLVTFLKPISRYTSMFWKPKPKPKQEKQEITLEQIEALIDAKLGLRQ
ncbi:MAG: DUF1640 domain-containing protein [Synergistaceae bacterium]|nr:DUF1640 domain-containing protein [Synergistaceae bacterium]